MSYWLHGIDVLNKEVPAFLYLKANITKRKTTYYVRHNKVPQNINILEAQLSARLIWNINHTQHKYKFLTRNSTSLPMDEHYSSPIKLLPQHHNKIIDFLWIFKGLGYTLFLQAPLTVSNQLRTISLYIEVADGFIGIKPAIERK